jgi:thiol-disulfide isomerase/thioredoxin
LRFHHIKRFLILSFFILLSVRPAFAQDLSRGIPVLSQQDIIKQISQAKGKVVLINFWATWCQPCRMELPEFMRLRTAYPEDKLVMLGVSLDQDPSMLSDFIRKTPLNYSLFLGKSDVALGFNIRGIPKTLIYNQNGEQILNHDGYIEEDQLLGIMSKLLGG